MITRYNFELELERIAERFFLNAATDSKAVRGGHSKDNEEYFKYVHQQLKYVLNCQRIVLPKGECPDSGLFGDFNYKAEDLINWDLVKNKKIVVIEIQVPNSEKRYIEVDIEKVSLPEKITSKSKIEITLNDTDFYGEVFGIEFKASKHRPTKDKTKSSISVASFNSTCPSDTKTTKLGNVNLIHNLETSQRGMFKEDGNLKVAQITLKIKFSMYYFIVNDEQTETNTQIRYILLCRGKFFALSTTEEVAASLSKELKPKDLKLDLNLYRVSLRFRPFFGSKKIVAKGFGLYTSWEPKIPKEVRENLERETLLNEVEKVQQQIFDESEKPTKEVVESADDNVIYLNLRESRIRSRAA